MLPNFKFDEFSDHINDSNKISLTETHIIKDQIKPSVDVNSIKEANRTNSFSDDTSVASTTEGSVKTNKSRINFLNTNETDIKIKPPVKSNCLTISVQTPHASAITLRQNQKRQESSNLDMNLMKYKISLGYQNDDVHSKIFEKLSPLQEALVSSPLTRNQFEIEIISSRIKLFPFFRDLSTELANQLANVVEYRAVTSKNQIFEQNKEADAMCLILNGHVQSKIELPIHMAQIPAIFDYYQDSVIGDLDLLFNKDSSFNINDIIKIEDEFAKQDVDDDLESGSVSSFHRALQPNWFSSYHVVMQSEILVISKFYFNSILTEIAVADLKKRFESIKSCGIFKSWSNLDMLRLARMGSIRPYKTGDILLEQGKNSDFLYIIVSGVCKVKKRADKTEILARLLAEARQKAVNHDLKYTFHHRLRNITAPVDKKLIQGSSVSNYPNNSNTGDSEVTSKKTKISLPDSRFITIPEVNRVKLAEEISKLEVLLAKEQAIKLKEEQDFEEALELALKNKSKKIPSRNMSDCDICTLNWPRYFGEASLLDSDNPMALGTVVAESACEILLLHKYQLQTFHVGENLLLLVSAGAIKYPTDAELIRTIDHQKEWKKYRENIMQGIPKHRWPIKEIEIEQMVFSNQSVV